MQLASLHIMRQAARRRRLVVMCLFRSLGDSIVCKSTNIKDRGLESVFCTGQTVDFSNVSWECPETGLGAQSHYRMAPCMASHWT